MSTGRPTQKMDHSLRQSVGAGMQSVFGRGGRNYYVLRHLTGSASHRMGEEQPIIIDYIEIGRDPKCQVRFDESQNTVSRRHAAIMREGNTWVLRNLSTKNPTLINGRPVNKQWYLTPGDQIQLSMEGPKMGFVMPSNPSVNSIPLTQRLNLFRRQALLPYKRAMLAMGVVFLLTISGLFTWLYQLNQVNIELGSKLAAAVSNTKRVEGNVDSLRQVQMAAISENQQMKSEMKALQQRVAASKKMMADKMREMENANAKNMQSAGGGGSSEEVAAGLASLNNSIFFIRAKRLVVEMDGEREVLEDYPLSGTGFLLTDGRFVTARHVVEPWIYFNAEQPDELEVVLNVLVNNGGSVYLEFDAFAAGGRRMTFTTRDFVRSDSRDESVTIRHPESGQPILVTHANFDDGMDWAYCRTRESGDIPPDSGISRNLPVGAELHILGYPFGLGTEQNLEPIQSSVKTAAGQLKNNVILVTGSGIEPGNSGGPVFYYTDGRYRAVGIVSAKASSIGFLVPIANMK